MKTEMMEKLTTLWNDEAFVDSLAEVKNDQQALDLFAENGVTITPEDLAEFKEIADKEAELSEEDLEDVTGGLIIRVRTLQKIRVILRVNGIIRRIYYAWRYTYKYYRI